MSVRYIPFESKSGFKSPGFLADEAGNVTVQSLTVAGANGAIIRADELYIQEIQILEGSHLDSSLVALGSQITGSSLKILGELDFLDVAGDTRLGNVLTPSLTIVNGQVTINSIEVGSVDNVDIGLQTPGAAAFTTADVGIGGLNVEGDVDVTSDLTIGGTTTMSGDLALANTPTASNHATRKDYVDARVSAFAIAFGA